MSRTSFAQISLLINYRTPLKSAEIFKKSRKFEAVLSGMYFALQHEVISSLKDRT